MPLRLFNTLTRQVEPFTPRDPAHVTFYTCGPTVYDDAHIGNFRSFLAADMLRRWIESALCEVRVGDAKAGGGVHAGPRRVTHVMNITDVGHMTDDAEGGEAGEDRMAIAGRRLEEAKKSGKLPAGVAVDPRDPYQIARFYEMRFREDAKALNLKLATEAEADPGRMPRATANVENMKRVIERLMGRGYAYVVGAMGQRAVYFDVQKFEGYGRLSGNTLDSLRTGAGGRVAAENQANKRHPADFLLWKEDASHIMKWDSPWGAGYPGWHIECTAMSVRSLLGEQELDRLLAGGEIADAAPIIDLHSGGEDNIFPHHECEVAQSCAAFNAHPKGAGFAAMWFHPRFLLVEGTKMSKSKGNFFTARDLFAKGVEPAALRLELIKTHYRSNANFTEQGLKDSQRMVERWRKLVADAKGRGGVASPAAQEARAAFAEAMNEDLNIAGAIAAVNMMVNAIDAPTEGDAEAMGQFDAVLGVLSLGGPKEIASEIGVFVGVEPDPEVNRLLEQRRAARAAKDFKASDAIRDQLLGKGLAIKDMAGGKVEVRRA